VNKIKFAFAVVGVLAVLLIAVYVGAGFIRGLDTYRESDRVVKVEVDSRPSALASERPSWWKATTPERPTSPANTSPTQPATPPLVEPEKPEPAKAAPPVSSEPRVGDDVVLTDEFLVGTTWDSYEEARKLLRAKDEVGLTRMERRGAIFVASKGTQAKLIEKSAFSVRVRITNGPHKGKDGWLPFEFIKKD
jgi:hypothetical protein